MGIMKKENPRWKPKFSREELERRRLAAGKDLLECIKASDVARKYNVNPSSVTRWKKNLDKDGMEGLKMRKASGKESKLTKKQQKDLRDIIIQGATAYGYKTDLWTLRRVAEVIRKEFNVSYHFRSLSDVLHRMGFSPQKPVRRSAERNQAAVQKWVEEQWEKDRKKW